MRIQTILNRVEKFKSFVYRSVRLEEQDDGPALVVSVEPNTLYGRSKTTIEEGTEGSTSSQSRIKTPRVWACSQRTPFVRSTRVSFPCDFRRSDQSWSQACQSASVHCGSRFYAGTSTARLWADDARSAPTFVATLRNDRISENRGRAFAAWRAG